MSALPHSPSIRCAPLAERVALNRLPLAKSAPPASAPTNDGISAGSADPSASSITMMSPVAAANPQASALPFPRRVCCTTVIPGHSSRATSTVPSTECPSTRITSWTCGSLGRTTRRFAASFKAGMTIEIVGGFANITHLSALKDPSSADKRDVG
ncbi:hypothetical protein BJF78_29350 [Pseudonocardia sp. CNS-139]|nr:hypothetical protein BJF78_29350 [Pseudonocardia sp. CNS-139]